ncbi:MAG: zinc ABC transporter substrate-binding protein [Gammaproteobacteria bacterium]|jgi:zinc/manganese transport system substrate-binding protein|nr:zinc ABC transporter substrate-binding protein [Gammaproteobacteria bacterium]
MWKKWSIDRLAALMWVVAALGMTASPAQADIRVLACEPEWGALAREIAGDLATVTVATTAHQDPHRVEARPSLIAAARQADLLVCTGAELEIGWLPLLQRESGNPRIRPGQAGHFEAAAQVGLLEVPVTLDRSQGDIHAAGNPHLHLDPRRLLPVAAALAGRFAGLDPANAGRYRDNERRFARDWEARIADWEQRAAPLRGMPVAVHHRHWAYLIDWLGMEDVVDLEPKPGVDPSAAHLAQVLDRLKHRPVRAVLYASHQSARPARWISQRADIPAIELPFTVGGPRADSLPMLYDTLIERLLAASRP